MPSAGGHTRTCWTTAAGTCWRVSLVLLTANNTAAEPAGTAVWLSALVACLCWEHAWGCCCFCCHTGCGHACVCRKPAWHLYLTARCCLSWCELRLCVVISLSETTTALSEIGRLAGSSQLINSQLGGVSAGHLVWQQNPGGFHVTQYLSRCAPQPRPPHAITALSLGLCVWRANQQLKQL